MKTQILKISTIIIFLLFFAFQSQADFERELHRNWPANEVTGLKIENKFGDIHFVSSRTDSLTISVKVTIKNLPQNRAQYLANQINFRFWITDGLVNARTDFGEDFKTNQEFSIEYIINVPPNKHLDVLNTYGNVSMGDIHSGSKFKIQYGNFDAQNLTCPNHEEIELEVEYGNVSINRANRINANISYTILNAQHIESGTLNSNYSILKINNIENINAISQYDIFQIETAKSMNLNSSFTSWTVARLENNLDLKIKYGDFSVSHVANAFDNINVNNQYGHISIGIPYTANYYLESECYFCHYQYSEGEIIETTENNNLVHTKLRIGNQESNSKVIVKSRYGSIKLLK